MKHGGWYHCPFGRLWIAEEDGALVELSLHALVRESLTPSALTDEAARQLEEYFRGRREVFSLPLAPKGSAFQQEVWRALQQIPYGETATYGELACRIGRAKAARAVGQACHQNPLWIVIPCHRVVGAGHRLTGYAGGIEMKRQLLELEAAHGKRRNTNGNHAAR